MDADDDDCDADADGEEIDVPALLDHTFLFAGGFREGRFETAGRNVQRQDITTIAVVPCLFRIWDGLSINGMV